MRNLSGHALARAAMGAAWHSDLVQTNRAVTMSDVARAAGVSMMTVSNVLNGRPKVSAETRLRVLEVVEELGYAMNLNARRLRRGRTGAIGLIVPRFDHQYYGELAARLSDSLTAERMHLVVEQSGASREGELSALSLARLQQYDGVLLSPVGLDASDLDRLHPDLPIVLLGEQNVPARYHHVEMGNVAGGRLATAHLLAGGSRRIAVLGGRLSKERPELRTEGWAQALREAGVEPDPHLVVPLPGFSIAEARAAVAERITAGQVIDGIFAVTDEIAIGVIAGLHDVGLRVPEDVGVVGFDNLRISEHIVPGLTSIDPDHQAIVDQVLRLLRLQTDDKGAAAEMVVGGVSLVVRGSTRAVG